MTIAKTMGELKVHLREHYAGHQALGAVHVEDQGDGGWMAYPEPELTDRDDKREFISVVARAKGRFHLVSH